MGFVHWLMVHLSQETGTSSSASRAYNFWSGFAGDLGYIAGVVSIITIYRRSKCQSCWRLVLRHAQGLVESTHYETCHKHTHSDHHDALRDQHRVLHPSMHSHLNRKDTPTKGSR